MTKLNEELDKRTNEAIDVSDAYKKIAKSRDKLLPRERVNAILDHGTPFLELS